jgi:chromosome segregation ATPase
MAYYNPSLGLNNKLSLDKYLELKKYITSRDEVGKLNEWYMASEHMTNLENKLKKQEEEINEYKNFFSLMKKLLPDDFGYNDIIG